MSGSLKKTGAPSLEELAASPAFPSEEQFKRGPVAVIECVEEIPCNPCESSCPRGVIRVGEPITNLPVIDLDGCVACGACVAACPGLAIYIKDYTYGPDTASISFPYEYLPLPKAGDVVEVVDRYGGTVCKGTVLKVRSPKAYDRTAVVTVEYPKEFFYEAISMKRLAR